jgi:hypothetical protein
VINTYTPRSSHHHEDIVHFLKTATPPDVLTMCKLIRIRDRPDTSKRRPAYVFAMQSGGPGGDEVHLLDVKRTFKGKHAYYNFQVRHPMHSLPFLLVVGILLSKYQAFSSLGIRTWSSACHLSHMPRKALPKVISACSPTHRCTHA